MCLWVGNMRVIIEGNIGCGKTTVLQALAGAFPHAHVVPEPVEQWSEELELFRRDPDVWALPFSLRVLLAHQKNARHGTTPDSLALFERSPLSTRHVFTQLLFNDGTMPAHHWNLFREYYDVLGWEPGEHDVILFIDTPVNKCLERIQARGSIDDQRLDVHALRRIEFQYHTLLKFCAATVLTVSGEAPRDRVAADAVHALTSHIASCVTCKN